MHYRHRSLWSRGMTLIELVIVVLVLGLLLIVLSSALGGVPATRARALALYNVSKDMAENWYLLTRICGVTDQVPGNPLIQDNASALAVLSRGPDHLKPRYLPCYARTGITPLNGIMPDPQPDNAGPGAPPQPLYKALGEYALVFSGGGSEPLVVEMRRVPQEVVLALVQSYGYLADNGLAAADTTHPKVRYQRVEESVYTVWLRFQI